MSSEIHVEPETYAALEALRGDSDSVDDVVSRLLRCRSTTIESGAGLWEGTDAAMYADRERTSMKRDTDPR